MLLCVAVENIYSYGNFTRNKRRGIVWYELFTRIINIKSLSFSIIDTIIRTRERCRISAGSFGHFHSDYNYS